jgi:hypothetical protein
MIVFYTKYTSNKFEVILESMPENQKKEFIRTQMIIVKVYALWMTS